jgi:hypothetical protein
MYGLQNNFIMKEITICFTDDELVELAKQLYMASYLTIGFPYDNLAMAEEIFNKVCATGFLEVPERGAFRHGGFSETPFTISLDLDNECDPIIEQYEASAVEEQLPYALADRDFVEKYGKLEPMEVLHNSELLNELQGIQEKYKQEIERYGVIHLRLEEKK